MKDTRTSTWSLAPSSLKWPVLVLVLGSTLAAPSAHCQTPTPGPVRIKYTYDQLKEDLAQYIHEQMGNNKIKGLSVALVDGDHLVWIKGFGFADEEKKVPATENTLYRVGSPSKIFTAVEILKLVEEKKVGLDQPVGKYIPGFSLHSRFKRAKAITVRALLANHSGLPGFFLKGLWVPEPESLKDFVKDLKFDYLVSPPQTFYKYSYTDYSLLGRLVELKRRKPFADAIQEDLLDPLGMEDSTFENSPDIESKLAKGYRDGKETSPDHMRDVPAAGLISSASDIAKFLQFVLGGAVEGDQPPLRAETVESMFETQYGDLPLDFGHQVGLGWMLTGLEVEGSEGAAWHDGQYPPFVSQVVVLNRQKLGVVALSNSEEAARVTEDVAVRALKLMIQAKYGLKEHLDKKKIEMPKTVEVPKEKLDQYAGTYSALGQLTQFKAEKGHLTTEFLGHGVDLLPISQDTFVPHLVFLLLFPVDLPQYPITFSNFEGRDVAVLGGLTYPLPFDKIQPVDIPEDWKGREGEYELENPDGQVAFEQISLGEKDGFLKVDLKASFKAFNIKERDFKVALLPLSDEDAMVPGLFYGDGGTLHAAENEDGETRIFYSGYWFKKKKLVEPVKPGPRPVVPAATSGAPPSTKGTSVLTPVKPALTPVQPAPRPTI